MRHHCHPPHLRVHPPAGRMQDGAVFSRLLARHLLIGAVLAGGLLTPDAARAAQAAWPEHAEQAPAAHEHLRPNAASAAPATWQDVPWPEVLFRADQALQQEPASPSVQRDYVLALQRAGLYEPALRFARQHPDLLTPAQWRTLEADAAALKTRLAVLPPRSGSERFVMAERALALYDTMLSEWPAQGDAAASDLVRIRIDRLSALHARSRMPDVVRGYEALRAEGITVPMWALPHVADAYLSLREPERARDLYRALLAELDATTRPEERDHLGPAAQRLAHETGLFYALVETGELDQLKPLLERIQGYGPAWLHFKGQPRAGANTRYLDAQLILVAAQMALDDTPAAQARMEALVKAAPNNTRLREMLAGIYRARALPRRAERQLKLAETMTPRALAVEINQGVVALDLQEWQQVELLSADTLARAPDSQAARALARQWALHNKAELRISSTHGIAAGSQVTGRDGLGLDAVAHTAPINYYWRLFAGSGHAQGRFAEGPGHFNWQRAGVQWRRRDWTLEGELSANSYGHGARTGARLTVIHDVDDHWRIGADLERLSRNSPLRALRDGVTSDTLGAYVRWRAHERREWWLSLTSARFSDGNQRLEFDLDGRERVYTGARLKLDAQLNLSAQTNSQDAERLYFNPKRAFTLLPALRARHTLYRRYERVWEQEANVSAGAAHQRGYGMGRVLALGYGQRWYANDVFDFGASVHGISRPYDGRREREWQLRLDLNLRF